MPCEPYVCDEFVEFRQRQHAAALRVLVRNSVEEKSVKISCKLTIPDFSQCLVLLQGDKIWKKEPHLPFSECSFVRLAACPASLDFRSCLRASCPALRDSGWNTFSFFMDFDDFFVGAMTELTYYRDDLGPLFLSELCD